MMRFRKTGLTAAVVAIAIFAGSQPANLCAAETPKAATANPLSPSEIYGPLYVRVEEGRLFADSKTFADAVPKTSPSAIVAAFDAKPAWSDEALKTFVADHFDLPTTGQGPPAKPGTEPPAPIELHIQKLWTDLTRATPETPAGSSALALPAPYVVPGGRFRELYYWDSYFTMLGLVCDGRNDLVDSMLDDFTSLIERYGHIPNGARTYYLSRSQPPLFFAMVGLSKSADPAVRARRLRAMRTEYGFWMAGAVGLAAGQAQNHVVAMPDGSVLNRYFDSRSTPRDESYREDVAIAAQSGRPASDTYHDLRSAAESGWDFSSRWLADGRSLDQIHTTDIIPVDLNALLYGLETAIESECARQRQTDCARDFHRRAAARARAVRTYLWDAGTGVYRDYDWRARAWTPALSAATLYPLFTGLASPEQGRRVSAFVDRRLLAPGGLRTTLSRTGQQWDSPNGWAPLQWIGVAGLRRYGQSTLAETLATRWLKTVRTEYGRSGRLLEKYDIEEAAPGGGGEYPLQDGFGWTNGVFLALSRSEHPKTRSVSTAAMPVGGARSD